MSNDETWQQMATEYEAKRSSDVGLDALIEWPAQRRAVGDVAGLRILDLGCGHGTKAVSFAEAGASRVVGIDIVDAFTPVPDGLDVNFCAGDLSNFAQRTPVPLCCGASPH